MIISNRSSSAISWADTKAKDKHAEVFSYEEVQRLVKRRETITGPLGEVFRVEAIPNVSSGSIVSQGIWTLDFYLRNFLER